VIALGRYHLLEEIGRGGMGVVHRAKDTKLGREIALKVLPDDLVADPERRQRLVREARRAAAVSHPSLVAIYDWATRRAASISRWSSSRSSGSATRSSRRATTTALPPSAD
jgi:serine/threonine protein kinase